MKIFRIIATDGPHIKTKHILAKNKKQAKEFASLHSFSNYIIDTIPVENPNAFWNTLSDSEKEQFKKALLCNYFFNKEVI